ncbi:efflux RND transporter periplasmic adaptor subunit [Bartonella krasnovii]|uniref:Efflux RND transporter periplasmic adaptor subunit n=1 Tax=Bartonella krasnovii TaxID=2267275 RepID=A0A5B9CYQ6_9HYPH|nr:efflux RND transporter periplasmic adaptor subunit [Bartonella krasnovii]QEE11473.1 efflux RND transporter periplasmic adaptor subunit [Bartonella krasnovii]UNF37201.1 efflux RND transporter periplasmic adaptor subunit [Bartonella krasnovii]UNF38900.1 efflux RND transporter periplasmic adaptor subunit [Bartonella krasnovii]UNF40628.1 efflux RND transporter periplasmic adaptor subunit [Bartonella krasnovii]UNF42290.1 efflux RND transporter periplasmic adaptor subunit [Bartonella krasnovii]
MALLKKIFPLVLLIVVLTVAYRVGKQSAEQPISMVDKTAISYKASKGKIERPPAHVVVDFVKTQDFYEHLNVIGSGKALAEVDLIPLSSGVIDKLFVSAGTKVQVGDVIAKLDSKKEEIAAAKAKVQRDNNALTLSRILKLRASNTATEVQEITARLELDNANLVLRNAEVDLERRTIRAPISGVVGILPVDAGNNVTLNTVIGRIENRERILVDIWIPERYVSHIHKGDKVTATLTAQPDKTFVGHIYAIDNVVDPESRTLHVQVEINNEKDTLMSGMSFSVALQFHGGSFPIVNPLAIQWNSKGSFVWRVREGKVESVPVSIIQHEADQVFVKAPLENDDQVVIQGVQMLYPGSKVIIDDPKSHQQRLSAVYGTNIQ